MSGLLLLIQNLFFYGKTFIPFSYHKYPVASHNNLFTSHSESQNCQVGLNNWLYGNFTLFDFVCDNPMFSISEAADIIKSGLFFFLTTKESQFNQSFSYF